MFVKHIGTIIQADCVKSIPLVALSKKKIPMFVPEPMNNGTIKNAMNNENTILVVILEVIYFSSFFATAVDKSGIRA